MDWHSFVHHLPNPAVALSLLPRDRAVLTLPSAIEWLAFLCRWVIWDPLAVFPALRDDLCCPACGQQGEVCNARPDGTEQLRVPAWTVITADAVLGMQALWP